MAVEKVCRISVSDLNTIRLVAKGIATELPLDFQKIAPFLHQQAQGGGISEQAKNSILALAQHLLAAQQIKGEISVEFIIPDGEDDKPRGGGGR
jgi:predicted secreted hydrolase